MPRTERSAAPSAEPSAPQPRDKQWVYGRTDGLMRVTYRDGRAEIRKRENGLADGFIDGEYFGEVCCYIGRAMQELERRVQDGWHAAGFRFHDRTWRRTSGGLLGRYTQYWARRKPGSEVDRTGKPVALRAAIIVQLPTGQWSIVDQDMNQLELLDWQEPYPDDYKPEGWMPRCTTLRSFASEADAVHAAETRLGRWSDVGRDPR